MADDSPAGKRKHSGRGTFSALRSSNFRLYFAGQLVSISGTWMQNVAQGFLVFDLTKDEFALGIVACAAGLPIILTSPVAGVIVERVPRRQLMMFTQAVQMVLAFLLAALTFTSTVQVWHIIVLAFLLGITNSLDLPARQTFVVEMVGREDMRSGIALTSILNSSGRVLGPMAAGLALAKFGAAWCFFLNALSFVAVLLSLFWMQVPHAITYVSKHSPLRQLREGLSYARHDPLVAPLLLITSLVGLFGVPIIQLLPAVADVMLHSPKDGLAALSVAQGIGSVIAGGGVGWLAHRLGYGRVMAAATGLCAVATLLMAAQTTIPLASLTGGLSGLFLVLQLVSLNTLLQTVVPDIFRGRVMSLYSLTLVGFAPFGALLLGWLATVIGTASAIALYALLSGVGCGLVLLRYPTVMGRIPQEREPVLETGD